MVIGTVAAVLLAVAGAFGTDQIGLWPRLGYWLSVVLPGSVLGLLVAAGMRTWGVLAGRRGLELAVAAVMVAVPHTFVVVVASAIAFGADRLDVATLLSFFVVVLMLSLVITAINFAAAPRVLVVTAPPLDPATAELAESGPSVHTPTLPPAPMPPPGTMPPAFAERLPHRLRGGRLLALSAEDHYLRVHTDLGDDLVLLRMADAVALLAGSDGGRVHRSWWVSRAAVVGVVRDNDRLALHLAGGLVVPVSRAMRRELAQQGWFDPPFLARC